jgi:hypothetical protein
MSLWRKSKQLSDTIHLKQRIPINICKNQAATKEFFEVTRASSETELAERTDLGKRLASKSNYCNY